MLDSLFSMELSSNESVGKLYIVYLHNMKTSCKLLTHIHNVYVAEFSPKKYQVRNVYMYSILYGDMIALR